MNQYKKPHDDASFAANFALHKPRLKHAEAIRESARCLFCHDAPCIQACPTSIDIPLFIRQIQTGQAAAAAETIYRANWLGDACGQVCPTQELCEGACVHIHQGLPAVDIGRLQSYATASVLASGEKLFAPGPADPLRVAVVGGGPAGIAAACTLRMAGASVTVYEAKKEAGGLNRYGVAPYKYLNRESQEELNWLQRQLGFSLRTGSPVASREAVDNILAEHDVLFLAVGMGATRSLSLPGETLPGSWGAVEWIEGLRENGAKWPVPQHVVVIGGGNTAMDAAAESARCGAHVTLVYRGSRERMRAYGFEVENAERDGVRFLFHREPVAIEGSEHVTGLLVRPSPDAPTAENESRKEELLPAEAVIRATGQHPAGDWAAWLPGLDRDKKGRIRTDAKGQTNHAKVWAAGDAVNGGSEVVHAVAAAQAAASHLVAQWQTEQGTTQQP